MPSIIVTDGVRPDGKDQSPHQFTPGRVSDGMNDTPPAMRRFQAETQPAAGVLIEAGAKTDQRLNRFRRLFRHVANALVIAKPVGGRDGICSV